MEKYIMKQNLCSIGNKFSIYNQNQEICYTISGGFVRAFVDRMLGGLCGIPHETFVENLNGDTLLTIKKQRSGMFEKFEIKNDNNIIATISREKKLMLSGVSIVMKDRTYYIKGDIFAKNFTIYNHNDQEVANIRKFIISIRDAYELAIIKDIDKSLALALLYIIDSTFHN